MVKYTITLGNKGDNQTYSYSLELNQNQEDNPELILTKEITNSLQNNLEQKSSCKISDSQLQQIVNAWIDDIKEGYRHTQIRLKLKSTLDEKLMLLEDYGNQEIPDIIEPDLENIEPVGGMLPPLESILN